MSKLTILAAATILGGCASTGEWRALTIDGSSESAFGDSLAQLDQSLGRARSQLFALALYDIARTGVQGAEREEDGDLGYTDEDFRSELDGLTYEGVMALADQTGTPVAKQYYSGAWVRAARSGFDPFPDQHRPAFAADGRPVGDYRPGGANWATGADAQGHAEYMNR